MKGGLYASKRIYIPRAMGVKEYAFYDDMNYPNRPYMEDGRLLADCKLGSSLPSGKK